MKKLIVVSAILLLGFSQTVNAATLPTSGDKNAVPAILLLLTLPLMAHLAPLPASVDKKSTWYGGIVGGESGKVEDVDFSTLKEIAIREAGIRGRPVRYMTEQKLTYKAIPLSVKSRCRIVFGSLWQGAKLIERTKTREVCY